MKSWLPLLLGLALVITLSIAWSLRSDRFDFLKAFHPAVHDVDYTRIYTPPVPADVRAKAPHAKVYVFRPEQADTVLAAMKAELSDFEASSQGMDEKIYGKCWMFTARGAGPSEDRPAAHFFTGSLGRYIEDVYGLAKAPREPQRPACIVLVLSKKGWIESLWSRIR